MRYFAKLGANQEPINLYRFERGENEMVEDYWSSSGWKRDDDADVVGYLALGEGDFSEITEELARKTFPHAFEGNQLNLDAGPEVQKRFYDLSNDEKPLSYKELEKVAQEIWENEMFHKSQEAKELNYKMNIQGASVIVQAWGFENFFLTLHQVQKLHAKGQIKCWKSVCKACRLYNIDKNQSLIHHVMKISASQVKGLLDIYGKKLLICNWRRPQSDWALKHGEPLEHLNKLLLSGSKPVFYISLESEGYSEFLLGSGKNPELSWKEDVLAAYRKFCYGIKYDKDLFDKCLLLAKKNVSNANYPKFEFLTLEEKVQTEHLFLVLKEMRRKQTRVLI